MKLRKTHLLLLIVIAVIGAIFIGCKTRFATTQSSLTVTSTPERLVRGRELVFSICAGCHYDHTVNKFIGRQIEDIPGIAGKVYSANLTHSRTNGIAPRYTDAELKYLFKTGIARDGRFLNYMLRPNMADSDIDAIIAFLRSDDPSLSAADTTVGITHFTFIGKAYMGMHAKPVAYADNIKVPPYDDKVKLGYYLIDNLGCYHCHSGSLQKLNFQYPDQTPGYLAGGIKLKGVNGAKMHASNITPDKQTGIGHYTLDEFRRALVDGDAPGHRLKPPMPRFTLLKREEVDAIYAYLQTVPAVNHKVER